MSADAPLDSLAASVDDTNTCTVTGSPMTGMPSIAAADSWVKIASG
ncbi:MAG: hypothetical protein LBE44_11045 [Microbacterium hominis]|nr:hypothetical protein [Microbacterium hominis]